MSILRRRSTQGQKTIYRIAQNERLYYLCCRNYRKSLTCLRYPYKSGFSSSDDQGQCSFKICHFPNIKSQSMYPDSFESQIPCGENWPEHPPVVPNRFSISLISAFIFKNSFIAHFFKVRQ